MNTTIDFERAVDERYAQAARAREAELCCPVDYDAGLLSVIPIEIRERDYGCGDPSAYVNRGERVLDLGSGAGKICYIAAQIVGPHGSVVGIDANDEMLALARKHQQSIGEKLGYHNVEFRKGRIQDLRLDLALVDAYLAENPIGSVTALGRFNDYCTHVKQHHPLVADESCDVVLSNCVLNLVHPDDKEQLFQEIFRVVRTGGRVAISDIVSDEDVPLEMRNDPELWAGCISGAYREDHFLEAFDRAGFYGMEVVKRAEKPWRTIAGIEFRSITVVAYKGKQGPCRECNQAVIYRGPWRRVIDDDGHVLERGKRMAVCDKTFRIYTREPYASEIIPVEPYETILPQDAKAFDCGRPKARDPRETKGADYLVNEATGANCCEPGQDCC